MQRVVDMCVVIFSWAVAFVFFSVVFDGEKTNATEIKHDGGKNKRDENQTRCKSNKTEKNTNATAQLKITTHMCPLWNTIQLQFD